MPRLAAEDVLLLLADGADGPYDLDRFRLMKGAFLVAKLGGGEWDELFNFRPYDFGPFDSSVYSLKDSLVSRGLLDAAKPTRYGKYTLTAEGSARARSLEAEIGKEDADWIRSIGRWLTSNSFSGIANKVYSDFPEFATRSVMR
jgi:uncharacterized protein